MKKQPLKKANVTVNDIAKSVNISASTVSRALNNHPKISQKTKEKVWEAAKKLGYFPNIPAYMQQQKSTIVLLLVDNLQKSTSHNFILSAQNTLVKNGFEPLIKFLSKNELGHFPLTTTLEKIEITGIISLLEVNDFSKKDSQTIIDLKLPFITINKLDSKINHISIVPDWYNGAYLAVNHIVKQGGKNMILLVDDSEKSIYNELNLGSKAALLDSETGFTAFNCDFNKKSFYQEFEQLLAKIDNIDGIICSNNLITCKLYNYLNSKKIRVPNDVMLISFGNEPYMNATFPGVTTVEYSAKNLGTIAAKQITKLVNHTLLENGLIVEPMKLIIRDSSMPI